MTELYEVKVEVEKTFPPSPLVRFGLHPFKVGLGITGRSFWIFLKFASGIGLIVLGAFALFGIAYGVKQLVLWSMWTLIPLSIPPILLFIWLVGLAAVSIHNADEKNEAFYGDGDCPREY